MTVANKLEAVMLRAIQQEVKYLRLAQWSDRTAQILRTAGFYLACLTFAPQNPTYFISSVLQNRGSKYLSNEH